MTIRDIARTVSRSMSLRLVAIFLILALMFIYFSNVGLRWIYQQDNLRELISGHLSLHVGYVRRDIGYPPSIEQAVKITEQVPVDIRIEGDDIDWASDPAFPKIADLQFGESRIFSTSPEALLNELQDVEFARADNHRFLKIDQGNYSIVVSSPRIADPASSNIFLPVILATGLISLFIGWLAINWLFKPLQHIRDGAARIGSGDFNHRISKYRSDELGDLAVDVNSLASDVSRMLDAKRQLLLAISHELRSPLSRMRLATEQEDQEKAKHDLLIEVNEMEQIISVLLDAERLNYRHTELNRTSTLIAELVEQLLDTYFSKNRHRISTIINSDLEVQVDPSRTILLIKNLLTNAVRYSPDPDSLITLDIEKTGNELLISVADLGDGFNDDQIKHFAQPFYRTDPSRARISGGTGLGLYLARLVAEAHGGQLFLDSNYKDGAKVVAIFDIGTDDH